MQQQSQEPRRYRPAVVVATLALLGGLLVLPATPAVAASTYLCTGYTACNKAGYPHAGYKAASSKMYWRMYSGHNCTNYAAYRVVRNGMPNTRPWTGSGNASNWGKAMASITDATPMVGAIAWWKANVPGAGSSGHVAYVEEVVSPTQIVVSEDSWGGNFHWRRITKSGKGWPSGFIHFNDRVLAPTTPPAVVGTPQVGVTLSANRGAWKPAGTYAYQWSAAGKPIAGATRQTYTPTAAMFNKKLSVTVTATKKGYQPGKAVANAAAVAPGSMRNTVAPVISGVPLINQTLQVSLGTWLPTPTARTVRWFADGVALPGAADWSLTLGPEHVDKVITARVTTRATAYTKAAVMAAPTTPVLAGVIRETARHTLAGVAKHGRILKVRPGTLDPPDSTVRYVWLRDGVPVPGVSGPRYPLRAADVGAKMSVRLEATRPSYRSLTRTLRLPGRVTTRPTMKVSAQGRAGRAVVRVRMRAPGVKPFTGRVTVAIGSRSEVVRVVNGSGRVVLDGLRAGRKTVRARYAGTHVIKPVRATTKVRVLRR